MSDENKKEVASEFQIKTDPKFETIFEVMEQIPQDSKFWCKAKVCACKGCVQNSPLFKKGRYRKIHFDYWKEMKGNSTK